MEIIRQLRNEIAEHEAGGRKVVQEQHGWFPRVSGFAIENLEAVDRQGLEGDYPGRYPESHHPERKTRTESSSWVSQPGSTVVRPPGLSPG